MTDGARKQLPPAQQGGSPIISQSRQVWGMLHGMGTADSRAPLLVCIHGSGCNRNYFDLACNSFVNAAIERGFPVLLLDRPGHGASADPPAGSAIDSAADATNELLRAARKAHVALQARSIVLIGHSFGGAVALLLAAREGFTAVAGVCVSGIGDAPDNAFAIADRTRESAPPAYWLFGPGTSYDWRGVTALRAAAARWRPEEVAEINHDWPLRWHQVVRAITCPVHFRLAEHERIWETSRPAIDRITAAFERSARVDAAILPDGGHLYEMHLRGPDLVASQLNFIASIGLADPRHAP